MNLERGQKKKKPLEEEEREARGVVALGVEAREDRVVLGVVLGVEEEAVFREEFGVEGVVCFLFLY